MKGTSDPPHPRPGAGCRRVGGGQAAVGPVSGARPGPGRQPFRAPLTCRLQGPSEAPGPAQRPPITGAWARRNCLSEASACNRRLTWPPWNTWGNRPAAGAAPPPTRENVPPWGGPALHSGGAPQLPACGESPAPPAALPGLSPAPCPGPALPGVCAPVALRGMADWAGGSPAGGAVGLRQAPPRRPPGSTEAGGSQQDWARGPGVLPLL